MTRTEAIKAFLQARTHKELADLYNAGMEVQVNVAQDGGERITGEFRGRSWHGYTDRIQTWKPIRIPHNAHSKPEYEDTKMTFSLTEHAEGIGMTGWDWQNQLSRWVAFDFDAIAGHKEQHRAKVSSEDLEAVKLAATGIEWVTVRRSAGGRGLHLYVYLDPPVATKNHTEHAALGRAILGKMSAFVRFDFESKVDICGQNMWVWHRKMAENNGLGLIKQGLALRDPPPNWKDHVKVVTRHRKQTLPQFITDVAETSNSEAEKFFLELIGQMPRIPLDEEHKRLIQWLETNNRQAWWDQDNHMLVAHTFDLKEAHTDLDLRGIFDTAAKGSERGRDHNCFMYPLRRGAWSVRRYSMGVQEHPSWTQDGRGWTQCYYNHDPDIKTASKSMGALEDTDGAFIFKEAETAGDAAKLIGAKVAEIPRAFAMRKAALKEHRDGRLVMTIEGDPDADSLAGGDMMKSGWLNKKGKWIKIFPIPAAAPLESEITNFDDMVRHLTTPSGNDYGWVIRGEGEIWRTEPLVHVRTSLESMNVANKDIKLVLGSAVLKPWKIVNKPFQPEFPGNREWNKDAAQLRFVPSPEVDNLEYPHWKMILDHCGAGLNNALRTHPWAKANGITSGADYLKIWIASLFKEPYQPLPYLFFYGEIQNSGKSTFHESLSLLITSGYARADKALVNSQGFNSELANAILCVTEEIDLRKNKEASSRIKDWVTAKDLSIHPKGRTPYHVPNTSHWVQCANPINACPTFPGDTRITMIHVAELPRDKMIARRELYPLLEKEASDFLAEILRLEIPPSNDRLNVPVVATAEKMEVERGNETMLQTFMRECVYRVNGSVITKGEFFEKFTEWCPDKNELDYWTKHRISKEFPSDFPQGRRRSDGHHCYGNIRFEPFRPDEESIPRLIAVPAENGRDIYLESDVNATGTT